MKRIPAWRIGAFALGVAGLACSAWLARPAHAQERPRIIWSGNPDVNGGRGQPTYSYWSNGAPGVGYIAAGSITGIVGSTLPGPAGKAVTVTGGLLGAVGAAKVAGAPPVHPPPPSCGCGPVSPVAGGVSSVDGPPPSGDVASNKDAFRVNGNTPRAAAARR